MHPGPGLLRREDEEVGARVAASAAEPAPRASAGDVAWRADVQGLRAVAVLLVVAFHAGVDLPGGYVGVDVFFVISGFVITRLLVAELEQTSGLDLRTFYARRARRLLPALALTVAVTVAMGLVVLSPLGPRHDTAATGAAASVFLANAQLARSPTGYFDVAPEANALLHTWSLSVEEQVYLVVPGLLLLAWRASRARRVPRRALAGWVLGAVAASLAACAWLTPRHPSLAFYLAPTRVWEFGAGTLLAIAAPWVRSAPRVVATAAAVTGAGLLAVAVVTFGPGTSFPGLAALVPVVGTAALLAAGTLHPGGLITRALGRRPLTWIGDRSYGWYLWHWPFLVLARAAWGTGSTAASLAVAAAALVPAAWSYRAVERPLRRSTWLTGRRAAALAAACIVVPFAVSAAVWHRGDRFAAAATVDAADQFGPHLDAARGCNTGRPGAAFASPLCTWSVPGSRGRVVLVGDSNAGQFAEGLLAATRAEGYDLAVATMDGCPFARLTLVDRHPDHPVDGSACRRYVERTLELLTADPPSLVLVGSVSDLYLRDPGIAFTGDDGTTAEDEAGKADQWAAGLGAAVAALDDAGVPVAVVAPIPHFLAWDPRTCSPARLRDGGCGRTVPRAQVEAERRSALEAERRAVAGAGTAVLLDLVPELCGPDECTTNEGGRWRYHDGVHLTTGASAALADTFGAVLRSTAVPRAGG